MVSDEAIDLLRRIADSLVRIEAAITTRSGPMTSKSKRKRTPMRTPYFPGVQEVCAAWSLQCPELAQPLIVTESRKKKLAEFWEAMKCDRETVDAVFMGVAASDFLCGRKRGASFRADLFWVCRADTALSIIEGKYRNEDHL